MEQKTRLSGRVAARITSRGPALDGIYDAFTSVVSRRRNRGVAVNDT